MSFTTLNNWIRHREIPVTLGSCRAGGHCILLHSLCALFPPSIPAIIHFRTLISTKFLQALCPQCFVVKDAHNTQKNLLLVPYRRKLIKSGDKGLCVYMTMLVKSSIAASAARRSDLWRSSTRKRLIFFLGGRAACRWQSLWGCSGGGVMGILAIIVACSSGCASEG